MTTWEVSVFTVNMSSQTINTYKDNTDATDRQTTCISGTEDRGTLKSVLVQSQTQALKPYVKFHTYPEESQESQTKTKQKEKQARDPSYTSVNGKH